jgi:hypothetical protein
VLAVNVANIVISIAWEDISLNLEVAWQSIYQFWQANQFWLAPIMGIVIACLTIFRKFTIRFFKTLGKKIEERLDPKADALADWLVNGLDLFVRNVWWQFTARFKVQYYESIVYACRDFKTQGLKEKGAFALNLEKVFVSLKVAPGSASAISPALIQTSNKKENLEIWDFLAASINERAYRSIAVIAPPGSGKSTLLEHIALTYAKNTQRKQNRKVPRFFPVLLYLRDIKDDVTVNEQPKLSKLIRNQEPIKELSPPPEGWLEKQLRHKKCLVMFDGLDEIADPVQREQVSNWVNQQIKTYPKANFIVTSRPFGYLSNPLSNIGTVLEIQPFNIAQMEQFIHSWYLQNEILRHTGTEDPGVRLEAKRQSNDLINRIKGSSPLAAMALNPLLLTMIATVHAYRGALPGNRAELYAEICDVLLGRRRAAKGIAESLTVINKRQILQVLALELMLNKTREFSLAVGSDIIKNKLASLSGANPEDFIIHIKNSGLLVEREQGKYEFAHKSFQEYLAAAQIKASNQEKILTANIAEDQGWDETIRLYAALGDTTSLVIAALDKPNILSLSLAYDCAELGGVSPEVRTKLEKQLAEGLESSDPKLFKLAAQVKLSQRLNNLRRIDDNTEIDLSFITCAEYQLFIDDMLAKGKFYQPDHWEGQRFRPGNANKPITGLRASDAEMFCEWLSEYQHQLYRQGTGNYYRLPSLKETEDSPTSEAALKIGSWCVNGEEEAVAGIAQTQWQQWKDRLKDKYTSTRTSVLARALDRDRAIAIDRASAIARASARASAIARNLDRALDLDLDRASASASASARDLDYFIIFTYTLLLIAETYKSLRLSKKLFRWSKQSSSQSYEKNEHKLIAMAQIYIYISLLLTLISERRKGEMPVWESLRIVRYRDETNKKEISQEGRCRGKKK